MAYSFCNSLPSGFHAKISSQVKTMKQFKRSMLVTRQRLIWRQCSFVCLWLDKSNSCSWRPYANMSCALPHLLIDEYGCLCKGNKSILANRLGLKQVSAPTPDIVIVDMQQMLYYIVWPHGRDTSDLSENIYQVVFDMYDDLSAKDHEGMRRAGEGSTDYNLTANRPLPNRDAILKNSTTSRNSRGCRPYSTSVLM